MIFPRNIAALAALMLAVLVVPTGYARAELVLSQLVLDLQPGPHSRQDIEVTNTGPETLYVSAAPREVVGAGTSQTSSRVDPDPEVLGLLVSPTRMVLEPGERKLLRVAAITRALDRERVFRVTVKPVVGELSSGQAGLKILVGYDVLVLLRPSPVRPKVVGHRSGGELTLRNEGNASVELTNGRQCDASGSDCTTLPGGRLYVGSEKVIKVDPLRRATYIVKLRNRAVEEEF